MTLCPHPDCHEELRGRNAFLCPNHFFILPSREAQTLIRLKVAATRSPHGDIREHLESQLVGYIQIAIRRAIAAKTPINQQENSCV
ncbi:MAG: hypothetical protein JKX93_06280 [Rhizobiaceae bacterium]|nr:hypothetical protein [Rhizobiaceae bacterium]